MKYYIRNGQETSGPFSLDELKKQKVAADTLVYYKGLHEWTKANEILELVNVIRDSTKPGEKES